MKNLLIMAALSLSMAAPASAATLSITETSDFADNLVGISSSVGTTGLGTNTISGQVNGLCLGNQCDLVPIGDRHDSFQFEVAAGQQLAGITSATSSTGLAGLTFGYTLSQFTTMFETLETTTALADSLATISTSIYGPGTYFLSIFGSTSSETGDYAADWTMNLNVTSPSVSPVPLPASAPLLLAGLGLIAGLRRRKAR